MECTSSRRDRAKRARNYYLENDGLGGSEPLYEMSREVFQRGELSQDVVSNDSISQQADASSSQRACDKMAWLQSSSADVSGGLSVDENSSMISNTNKKVSWIYDYLELKALDGCFFEDRKGKQNKECIASCNIKPCNYSTTLSALRKARSNFIKHLDRSLEY